MSSFVDLCVDYIDWTPVFLFHGLLSFLSIMRELASCTLCVILASWFVSGMKAYVLPTLLGPVDTRKAYGRWALVTGCTGGIGRAYAMGLAAKGMDMVLVSRSSTKLEQMEKEIKEKFGVNVIVIQADFTRAKVLGEIVKQVEGLEIGVLVNNVGVNGGGILPFLEVDHQALLDLIAVNMTTATVLCHSILPAMIKRGRGAVINIGSTAGLMPGPYFAQYCASKHYMHILTQAIAEENKGSGVVIQEINPGLVETAMTEKMKEQFSGSLLMPTPEQFVSWALPSLGWTSQTCGYPGHSLTIPLYTWPPIGLAAKINNKIYEKQKLEKINKID